MLNFIYCFHKFRIFIDFNLFSFDVEIDIVNLKHIILKRTPDQEYSHYDRILIMILKIYEKLIKLMVTDQDLAFIYQGLLIFFRQMDFLLDFHNISLIYIYNYSKHIFKYYHSILEDE